MGNHTGGVQLLTTMRGEAVTMLSITPSTIIEFYHRPENLPSLPALSNDLIILAPSMDGECKLAQRGGCESRRGESTKC